MKKIALFLSLFISVNLLFAQNATDNTEQVIDRKQGKANLDAAKGFGDFIFGTQRKMYKNFKFIPDAHEPSKKYVSNTHVQYNGIMVNNVSLDFYKDRLFSITMHINKSEIQKLTSYCIKNYGPRGRDLDDDGTYSWRGKIKKITFYEIEDNMVEVLFIDDTDSNKRMEEASKAEFNR